MGKENDEMRNPLASSAVAQYREQDKAKLLCPVCQKSLVNQPGSVAGCGDGCVGYFQCECGCYSAWDMEDMKPMAWYPVTEVCTYCNGKGGDERCVCKGWGRIRDEKGLVRPGEITTALPL